jgi:hypothetical protein
MEASPFRTLFLRKVSGERKLSGSRALVTGEFS